VQQHGQTVCVIGDGAMGTVCATLLAGKGYRVRMWGPFREQIEALCRQRENKRYLPGLVIPDNVEFVWQDERAFEATWLIVSAVPCQHLRSVWKRLARFVPKQVPVCSVTKGIEIDTGLRPSEIIRDVLGDVDVVALSGPSIASELARKLPATVTAACPDLTLAELVQRTFSTNWFRVYTNDDILGVELAGAMKNVIALAAGILDGLGAGCNAKAALVTRGLAEIARLGMAMGAKRETFAGLAGLGDLVTTCISPASRNRTAGELIGKGWSLEQVLNSTKSVIEGIPTTKAVVRLARQYGVEMPITQAVHSVLFEGKDVIRAIEDLMTRRLKRED